MQKGNKRKRVYGQAITEKYNGDHGGGTGEDSNKRSRKGQEDIMFDDEEDVLESHYNDPVIFDRLETFNKSHLYSLGKEERSLFETKLQIFAQSRYDPLEDDEIQLDDIDIPDDNVNVQNNQNTGDNNNNNSNNSANTGHKGLLGLKNLLRDMSTQKKTTKEDEETGVDGDKPKKKRKRKKKFVAQLKEFDFNETKVGDLSHSKKIGSKPSRKLFYLPQPDENGEVDKTNTIPWYLKYIEDYMREHLVDDNQFNNIQNTLYSLVNFRDRVENGEVKEINLKESKKWSDVTKRENTLKELDIDPWCHGLIFESTCEQAVHSIIEYTHTWFHCIVIDRLTMETLYVVCKLSDVSRYGVIFEFRIKQFIKDNMPFEPVLNTSEMYKKTRKWKIIGRKFLELDKMLTADLGDINSMRVDFVNFYYVDITGIDILIKNTSYHF